MSDLFPKKISCCKTSQIIPLLCYKKKTNYTVTLLQDFQNYTVTLLQDFQNYTVILLQKNSNYTVTLLQKSCIFAGQTKESNLYKLLI